MCPGISYFTNFPNRPALGETNLKNPCSLQSDIWYRSGQFVEVNSLPIRFAIMPITAPDGTKAHYFITLVKLGPGKTPTNFMKAIDQADQKLARHKRGIHEDHTFVTLGRYDLVVIWRAPDLTTMGQYLQELFDACGIELGSTETLVATSKGA
jgi:uncharacterized protein with GYD domain